MRNLEPLRQLVGGSVGCLTVERHHRRRHAKGAAQLRAPAIPNGRHFNLVQTPANRFLEAVNGHVFGCP